MYLDEWLTKDTEKELMDFLSEGKYAVLEADSLSVYAHENGYAPVELRAHDPNRPERKLTVSFSDKTPEIVMEHEQGSTFHIQCNTLGMGTRDEKNRKKLRDKCLEAARNAEFSDGSGAAGEGVQTGGGSITPNEMYYEIRFISKADSKPYTIFAASECNALYRALKGDSFGSMALLSGLSYLVLLGIAEAVFLHLFHKNVKMEEARIAFTCAAAHELKTPIAAIASNCECVLERISPEKDAEYVNAIYEQSKRMNHLVKTLLIFNRLNVTQHPEKEKTDFTELVKAEAQKYRPLAEERGLTFETALCEGITGECNPLLLTLAVDNYLSNAVKYCKEGGTVRLTLFRERGKPRFQVYNTADGISREDAAHLWEPLYRGDRARDASAGSTGMGLAICKEIFTLHGFSYGFSNTDGGVVFWFS